MKEDAVKDLFDKMSMIHTPRLALRRLQPQDARDMYEYASLPEITRFLLWEPHPDLAYTKRYLAYVQGRYRMGDFYDLAVILRDTGKMIGTCGFVRFDDANRSAEVGYVLNPAYHRRGYGTEALSAILHFGFSQLRLHRIEARFMKENVASRRLAEKCGMQFEGIHRDMLMIKGQYRDIGFMSAIQPIE